ncbi:MAG: glycosyl hydrolase [Eubacteriales bacterium]
MKLRIDKDTIVGKIKPMNAVNNGPRYTDNADQNLTNLPAYREAHIPFARTHDAAIDYNLGGEHVIDVLNIFPDFHADPCDPASYDFQLTDEYLRHITMCGTEVFYRLGNKIEHWSKRYGVLPPKDFHKWAVICEHIIAHYNEGWANGFHMGIRYWEIWNEPDLFPKCWDGTAEQFYDLYAVASKHLKERFPDLKIGGPAVCCFNESWLRPFFTRIRDEKLPFDFYSWHIYASTVSDIMTAIRRHRALLDEYGFTNTESILDEWNYVRSFNGEAWKYSLEKMIGMKGAAFTAAVMAAAQDEPVDMLMYYDARLSSGMNCLFDGHTCETRKGYHAVKVWSEMLSMGDECRTTCDVPDIWAVSAVKDGKTQTMAAYYTDDDHAVPRTFKVEMTGEDTLRMIYLLDDEHDLTPYETIAPDNGCFTLTMKPNTVVVIE